MNKNIIIITLTFLLLISTALATANLESQGWWSSNNNAETGTNRITSVSTNFDAIQTFSSTSNGANFQAITYNFQNDTTPEIITSDGSFIKAYTLVNKVLTLTAETSLGASQNSPYEIVVNGTETLILAQHGNTLLYILRYNGTHFIQKSKINGSSNADVSNFRSYIKCTTLGLTNPLCFWGNDKADVLELPLIDLVPVNYSQGTATSYFEDAKPVAIGDLQGDGNIDVVFITDEDNDNQHAISVYDRVSKTFAWEYEQANYASGTDLIMDVAIANIDGNPGSSGLPEVIFTADVSNQGGFIGDFGMIKARDSNGGSVGQTNIDSQSCDPCDVTISGLVAGNMIDSNNALELCAITEDNSGVEVLGCIDGNTFGTLFSNNTVRDTGQSAGMLAGIDADGDGLIDIVTKEEIHYIENNLSSKFNTSTKYDYISFGDMDLDGLSEIIQQSTNNLVVFFSNFTDNVPVFISNIGTAPTPPVCNATTITFSAKEDTSYTNDLSGQTERLTADCYGNGTLTYGAFTNTEPTVTCTYYLESSSSNTYQTKIYIQENSLNINDTSSYKTEQVIVLDGIAGSTCNLAPTSTGSEGTSTAPVITTTSGSAGIESSLNFLTGGNTKVKMLFGLIILLIVLIGVGQLSGSMAIGVISAIITLSVLTALGMFSAWILVLFIITVIFLGALGMAFNVSGNGGV